jgi:hypothetical protein
MGLYRKKPVVVDAVQWDGTAEMAERILVWIRDEHGEADFLDVPNLTYSISITTLEGEMCVLPNDWVIQGVKGEFYPCKPDIFKATYEEASEEVYAEWRRTQDSRSR